MNNLFVVSEMFIMYLLLYVINILFGKKGIMLFIIISVMMFMLFSNSFVNFLGFPLNEGVIIYGTGLFALNLLNQKYGSNYLEKFIYVLIIIVLMGYGVLDLVHGVGISSNLIDSTYFDKSFVVSFRDCVSVLLAFSVSANFGNYLYYKVKMRKNKIWISNLITTVICGFVDTFIYSLLAYAGGMDIISLVKVIIINSIVKIIVGVLGTVYIYRECKI